MDRVFYESVFRVLGRHQVRHLIVGGVAVNLLGVPRMTNDLDLMLDLREDNVLRFIASMRELGYKPRAPVPAEELASLEKRAAWAREKNAVVFTFVDTQAPHLQIDIFLENPVDFDRAYAARQELRAEDLTLHVISLEHLIQMKTTANRLQDQADIAMLNKIQDERLEG